MSVVNKNTLGAGDGIQNAISAKKRIQVASSRRFATRGIPKDSLMKKKLQEALDTFVTPPQSPLGKRSQSIAEITPSKKPSSGGLGSQMNSKAASNQSNDGRLEAQESNNKSRMVDAGRRVSHQLVLNAWRRRRRQVAALTESRDRLQTQVDQLQIQVDVLQKLREAEGNRRAEAVGENKAFQVTLAGMKDENLKLQQTLASMQKKEAALQESIEKLNVEVMNERNLLKTAVNQKTLCEEAFGRERQLLKGVRDERNRLMNKIEVCEKEIEVSRTDYKLLEDVIKMTENKYEDSLETIKQLESKCCKLEERSLLQTEEIKEVDDLLNRAKLRISRLECKVHDLKKVLSATKQQKKKLNDDNSFLKSELQTLQLVIYKQTQKQWWKSTGEFVFTSLESFAQILFPALPPIDKSPDIVKCSISLGKL